MATTSDEEIRGLISAMTSRLLVNAADAGQRDRLKRAVRDWYPNQDEVDEFELRRITEMVATGLIGMANLVDERLERLIDQGRAKHVRERTPA